MTGLPEIEALFHSQLEEWEFAGKNYAALKDIRLKKIPFDNYVIQVQFNPGRITSSSAKVDPESINERPCFLCSHNRPVQQHGIPFLDKYIILVNPFPIFYRHFTIPAVQHLEQRIAGNFNDMLMLARHLNGYTIIYNGPNSGASAPDHFHFQAIPQDILPIEKDFASGTNLKKQGQYEDVGLFTWLNYQRNPITLNGTNPEAIEALFLRLCQNLEDTLPSSEEPMMNILAHYSMNRWTVHVFPRILHRPHQYYETGDKQLLLSPGSIDMGGILIMPREIDFDKISRPDVEDIFSQVCADDRFVKDIMKKITV